MVQASLCESFQTPGNAIACNDQELRWVQWWAEAERHADFSWRITEKALATTPLPASLLAFLEQAPQPLNLFASSLGYPPQFDARMWPLTLMGGCQLQQFLALATTICVGPASHAKEQLPALDLIWCQRVSKALRPELWLPSSWQIEESQAHTLGLLRAWVGEAIWKRLRLQFPRPCILQAELIVYEGLPASRLSTLWQALGWYITARG